MVQLKIIIVEVRGETGESDPS